MEATSTVSSAVDVPARLSSAQKRDLVGQAFAAVVTTALIAAPFVATPSDPADGAGLLPAQSFAGTAAMMAVAETEAVVVARPPARVRATLRASGRLMAADIRGLALQPQIVGTTGYTRDLDVAPMRSTPRKPLSRKLTGWLTGDGTHTVRPFPTVPSARP